MINNLTLKQVSAEDKQVLVQSLEFYINDIHHIKMQEVEKMLECIARRLYFRWFGLVHKNNVAKKSTLKIAYDEGYILKNAILRYQQNGNVSDLEHAILERYKFNVMQQLV